MWKGPAHCGTTPRVVALSIIKKKKKKKQAEEGNNQLYCLVSIPAQTSCSDGLQAIR